MQNIFNSLLTCSFCCAIAEGLGKVCLRYFDDEKSTSKKSKRESLKDPLLDKKQNNSFFKSKTSIKEKSKDPLKKQNTSFFKSKTIAQEEEIDDYNNQQLSKEEDLSAPTESPSLNEGSLTLAGLNTNQQSDLDLDQEIL